MSAHAAAADAVNAPPPQRRFELTGAWLLSGAMLAAGVLAYAFHILAAQTLSQSQYGQIAVLWAALFLTVVVLFRPLEQTTARAVADRLARGQEARSVLRSVALVYGCALGLVAVGAVAFWGELTDRFFDGNQFMTAMLVVGIAGYGIQYIGRGILGGLRRFRGLSAIHVTDGTIRFLFALPLLAVASPDVAAVALAAAGIGGAIPPLWRFRAEIRHLSVGASDEHFHMRAALGFAAPAVVIAAADQLLVNGAPLVVVGSGGSQKAAANVFAATMLVRVPVFLFTGVAGSFLPNLTRLNAEDDHHRFVATVIRVCVVFLGATVAIVVVAALLGPTVMPIVFGSDYHASAKDLALLGLAAGCYLAAATISQALLALNRGSNAAVAWAIGATLFVCTYHIAGGSPLHRASLGIASGMVAATVLLVLVFSWRVHVARRERAASA
jgi:O-antigen/teichoic acid export membrane protein